LTLNLVEKANLETSNFSLVKVKINPYKSYFKIIKLTWLTGKNSFKNKIKKTKMKLIFFPASTCCLTHV